MRVLVLGADGFVGRRTVAALAASDWATPVEGARRPRASGHERIILDATDASALAAAAARADAIVNCVAGNDREIVANARALATAAAGKRLVHLSSMAVYGSETGTIDEDAPQLADTGSYATAKAKAERLLAPLGDVVMLRPGCIYGPGSARWTWRVGQLLEARRIGDLGAEGDGCSNIVHVDDVAAAVCAALRLPRADAAAFNLAMPDAPDWNGYFLAFARALGAVPVRRIPGWEMRLETKLLAIPLELGHRLSRRIPPSLAPSLAALWRQDIRLSSARASSTLAINWTPLDAGLAGAAAWFAAASRPRSDA